MADESKTDTSRRRSLLRRMHRGSIKLDGAAGSMLAQMVQQQEQAKKQVSDARARRASALFEQLAASGGDGQLFWLTDPDEQFVPARQMSDNEDGTKTFLVLNTGREVSVKPDKIGPPLSRLAALETNVADMVRARAGS